MFRWAVRKKYVRESPFAEIHPVGRPNRGKKQLRFDEAERFISAGFHLVAASDSYRGKTVNARRDLEIPKVLISRLVGLAAGREPDEYLFGIGSTRRPRCPQVLHAATLGHGSLEVTAKHYVQPGTLESSRTSRLVELLLLEKPQSALPTTDKTQINAAELLSLLPAEVIGQLVALASKQPIL